MCAVRAITCSIGWKESIETSMGITWQDVSTLMVREYAVSVAQHQSAEAACQPCSHVQAARYGASWETDRTDGRHSHVCMLCLAAPLA